MQFMDKDELMDNLQVFDENVEDLYIEPPEPLEINLEEVEFDVNLEELEIDIPEIEVSTLPRHFQKELQEIRQHRKQQEKEMAKLMAKLEIIRQQHYKRLKKEHEELIMEYEFMKKHHPKTDLSILEKHIKFVEELMEGMSDKKEVMDKQTNLNNLWR